MDEINKEIKKDGIPVLDLRITRKLHGVSIFIKSQIFEDFFRAQQSEQGLYDIGNIYRAAIGDLQHGSTNRTFLLPSGAPNLKLLCLVGIENGTEVEFLGAWSDDFLRAFATAFKNQASAFYKKFIRKLDIHVVITTTEIL